MMFREMRRKDRQLKQEETLKLLKEGVWGTLSVIGDEGYPYGVPVNYAFTGNRILIHGTNKESHKLDAIRKNPKVCFTVVSKAELNTKEFSIPYASVIVFGNAKEIADQVEKISAIKEMMQQIAPGMEEKTEEVCKRLIDVTSIIEIVPEHMRGKCDK